MPTTITRPGVELLPSGDERGLDPRDMTPADLNAIGHEAMSPGKALRLRCLDCSGGAAPEVRACTATRCPAWPFRMGANPWRAPVSEERREAARATFARARRIDATPPDARKIRASDERTDLPATLVADDCTAAQNQATDQEADDAEIRRAA